MEGVDWVVVLMAIKGAAAYIANNTNTQKWGVIGKVIEFIGSVDKKAKLTGDSFADSAVKIAQDSIPQKTIVGKLLKFFS